MMGIEDRKARGWKEGDNEKVEGTAWQQGIASSVLGGIDSPRRLRAHKKCFWIREPL